MNYWNQSEKNIYVAAHRGLSEKFPENTLEAFSAAIEIGVDQIETDVRISKDGELVIIHDATVDRTTDGTGAVNEKTLAELKALDAGIKKGEEFAGCKIPTFTEFMELVKNLPEMTVDIELKEYPVNGNEEISYSVCDRVLKMIDDYGYTDRCVINTFSGKLHEYIHGKYAGKYRQHVYYPARFLGKCTIDPYTYGYCVCMFGENSYIATKEDFKLMKEKYAISTWAGAGVKDAESLDVAIKNGAELITCNNPDTILRLLREKGYHK